MRHRRTLLGSLFLIAFVLTSCSGGGPAGGSTGYPNAPADVLAVQGTGTVVVTWKDTSSNEAGFDVYRAPAGNTLQKIGHVGSDGTRFEDTGVVDGTTYDYGVASVDSGGDGTGPVDAAASITFHATVLTFWHAFSGQAVQNWIQARADAWNTSQSRFKIIPSYHGSYEATLDDAIAAGDSGTPPNIVQVLEVGTQRALDSGDFRTASDVASFDSSDYLTPISQYYTVGGALRSIPFNSSGPMLVANADLMTAAGLDPSSLPTTFTDVLNACQTIEASSAVTASCIGFPIHSWFFEEWLAEQGATFVNNDNGRTARATSADLTGTAANRAMAWLKALHDAGAYSYTGALEDWGGARTQFLDQDVVFTLDSSSDVTAVVSGAQVSGFRAVTGAVPIPAGVTRQGVVIGGASLWIMKGHPQAEDEAALAFLLDFTGTDPMVAWHKLTGYFPVRKSAVDTLRNEGWFTTHPAYEAPFDELQQTQPSTATAGALVGPFLPIRTILEQAMKAVAVDGTDVTTALSNAKSSADAAIDSYNASH
jgi:sn-glycerol 3-phosphate transport system substrate-binding protein